MRRVEQGGERSWQLGRTGWFFLLAALGGLLLLALPPLPGNGLFYLAAAWLSGLVICAVVEMARLVDGEMHLLRAKLGWRAARAPERYVRSLFDTYAHRFDDHLMLELAYTAPNHLRDLIDSAKIEWPVATAVDLGCGTGVMAPLCRPLALRLIGVDLSAGMLDRAARRDLYDELERADIVAYLDRHAQAFDLLIAADVVVYLGDLRPLLAAATGALRPGGHFAFTTEHLADSDYRLLPSGRYAHCRAYVERCADALGLDIERVVRAPLRTEADRPVEGDLFLLRRPADALKKS